ncbi:uncharacterized, partial [Tachysurus ichikawai]
LCWSADTARSAQVKGSDSESQVRLRLAVTKRSGVP